MGIQTCIITFEVTTVAAATAFGGYTNSADISDLLPNGEIITIIPLGACDKNAMQVGAILRYHPSLSGQQNIMRVDATRLSTFLCSACVLYK